MSRSSSAAWTPEDLTIWGELALRWSARAGVDVTDSICAVQQDRRDAELMFEGQRIRSYTFPVDLPPIAWMLAGGPVVDLGGALQEWRTLNISYFA